MSSPQASGELAAPRVRTVSLPVVGEEADRAAAGPGWRPRLPAWLRRPIPEAGGLGSTRDLVKSLGLETICESGKCPNRSECWTRRTATFMILGEICTRPCGFCAVPRGRPEPPAEDEPERLAEACARLGLRHVVITSVTRDDLADGGADHFRRCVEAVRRRVAATIEVLTPDFAGDEAAVATVLESRPDVFNHNLETVARLQRQVRRKAQYEVSLRVLATVKRLSPSTRTKSGLMLGLGETTEEVIETLADLRAVSCDLVTLGQYLQPSPRHLPVQRYLPPDEFDALGRWARQLGFADVASGPFVRSSYHADEMARTGAVTP
ncbi:MAG: lipoyl synthase [Isosphaeraceae bacterium]|nr:MAG: lipoyl synthase [Isosphaeraceae bacterium]